MRTRTGLIISIFLISFSFLIISFFVKGVKHKNVLTDNLSLFKDSLGKLKMEQKYLNELVNLEMTENNRLHPFDTAKVYSLVDGKPLLKGNLKNVLKAGKEKLIIRYTEIGCNACTDKTIQLINEDKTLASRYDILFLVDFTNFEAYLKWRKLAEIEHPVLWVKKGDLPFDIENENKSYLFTINQSLIVNDFFFPNSLFPVYINTYLKCVGKKYNSII